MTELWREDLVDVLNGPEYRATSVVLDDESNLFVGGGEGVGLHLSGDTPIPFVAKFSPSGVKLWEDWLTPYVSATHSLVDGLASDMRGGLFVACRDGNTAFRLMHINPQGRVGLSVLATNYASASGNFSTTAGMTSDHSGGLYLMGISPDPTDAANYLLTVARYDQDLEILWRTNLWGSFHHGFGYQHAIHATSNGVFVCGSGGRDGISQVASVGADGTVRWVRDSVIATAWGQLAVLEDGTVCVGGERSCQVFSDAGERLAMHGMWSYSSLSHPGSGTARFVVLDVQSRNLLQVDSSGLIGHIGQLPLQAGGFSPGWVEMVNSSDSEWLIAVRCPESLFLNTNNLSFFCMNSTGTLKWRQPFAGYEYSDDYPPNYWLVRASDGTVRLVVNLNSSPANPHLGVAVAAFSVGGTSTAPVLASAPPQVVFNGPEGVDIDVVATGVGTLRYQWYFNGNPYWAPKTNGAAHVPPDLNAVWTVRVQDDLGDMVSPGIVVRGGDFALGMAENQYYGLCLDASLAYARQFQLETSADLVTWTRSPEIYSWLNYLPVDAVSTPGLGNHFFRSVEVDAP